MPKGLWEGGRKKEGKGRKWNDPSLDSYCSESV